MKKTIGMVVSTAGIWAIVAAATEWSILVQEKKRKRFDFRYFFFF